MSRIRVLRFGKDMDMRTYFQQSSISRKIGTVGYDVYQLLSCRRSGNNANNLIEKTCFHNARELLSLSSRTTLKASLPLQSQ
jgi:hypothetical protein